MAKEPKVDKNGRSYTEHCAVCGKVVRPSFKAVPGDPETYLHHQCDTCLEIVCESCSETDANGKVECLDCYAMAALKKYGVIQ